MLQSNQGPRADDVRGVVIGGAGVSWQVVYDGRPQSGKEYAPTSDAAMEAAQARIDVLKREHCGYPCYLYGEAKWEVRLWE